MSRASRASPAEPMDESSEIERRLPAGAVPTDVVVPSGRVVAIADLHLAPLGNVRTEHFARWCEELTGVAELWILGDLFDSWVGLRQARIPGSAAVLDALSGVTARGIRVRVIPGNRDLILDESFEARTGAVLHHEGFLVDLAPGRAAFVHGDALCTLDAGYQRLRSVWRHPAVRWLSRHAPLVLARWIGGRVRGQSEARKPYKPSEGKSIRPAAVAELARAASADLVVCGHAHEAVDGPVLADGAGPRRIIVGAWGTPGDRLFVEAELALRFDPAATPAGS